MGLFDAIINLLSDRKHNRELYKSGRADRNEVRQTAVGWQPDNSYTPDPGNDRKYIDSNGVERWDTPSGNKEYYKVVRKK